VVVLQYQAGQPPEGGLPRGHLVYAKSSENEDRYNVRNTETVDGQSLLIPTE